MRDLALLDAVAQADLIHRGEATATELVEARRPVILTALPPSLRPPSCLGRWCTLGRRRPESADRGRVVTPRRSSRS